MGVNTVYIYQFPIERTYNNLIARLFVAFIILSLLTVIGIMIFWEIAALNIITAYVVGIIIIGIVIRSIETKIDKQLEVRYVKTQAVNRLNTPPSIFSYHYFITHQIICPFCMHRIEIDQTNMTNIPIFSENDTICIHYRELTSSDGKIRYGKFVNLRNMDS